MNIKINDRQFPVKLGSSVAAAVMSSGVLATGKSISGKARAPFCGMGICYECRVTIDGVEHQRSCMILCRDGMEVKTS